MMRIGRDGCSWQWKCITVSCRGLLRDLTGARSCWRGGGAAANSRVAGLAGSAACSAWAQARDVIMAAGHMSSRGEKRGGTSGVRTCSLLLRMPNLEFARPVDTYLCTCAGRRHLQSTPT